MIAQFIYFWLFLAIFWLATRAILLMLNNATRFAAPIKGSASVRG